jgi:hypothetical protein
LGQRPNVTARLRDHARPLTGELAVQYAHMCKAIDHMCKAIGEDRVGGEMTVDLGQRFLGRGAATPSDPDDDTLPHGDRT